MDEASRKKIDISGHNIFCAALDVYENGEFDSPTESISKDLYGISNCDCFVFVYPQKIASSALIELGYALALKKPILMVAQSYDDLPFMAKGLADLYDHVAVGYDKPFSTNAESIVLKFISELNLTNR